MGTRSAIASFAVFQAFGRSSRLTINVHRSHLPCFAFARTANSKVSHSELSLEFQRLRSARVCNSESVRFRSFTTFQHAIQSIPVPNSFLARCSFRTKRHRHSYFNILDFNPLSTGAYTLCSRRLKPCSRLSFDVPTFARLGFQAPSEKSCQASDFLSISAEILKLSMAAPRVSWSNPKTLDLCFAQAAYISILTHLSTSKCLKPFSSLPSSTTLNNE